MTCKFITGSRRSGKTEKLYEDIFAALAQGTKKVYLILPEQSTFYHEKNLEKYRRGRSVWDLEITSFRRLAEKFVPTPLLSPLGQQLTLFQALNSHKDEFQSFQVKDISPGLVDAALSAVEEALLNSLTAESLREKAASIREDGVAGDLPKKLLDLALLLSEIESQGNSQGVFDGNLLLKFFLTTLEKGNILQDSLLFFDDFSDFTTVEYSIIQSFLRLDLDLCFAFTYCPGDIKFRKVAQAIEGITKMAQAERRQVTRIALETERENTPLTYLAKHCLGGGKPFSGKNNNEVTLFHGSEPAGEIEGIAREICRLKEQGYSTSDICVNFRDIVPYLQSSLPFTAWTII